MLDQARDLVARRNFDGAIQSFEIAIEKFNEIFDSAIIEEYERHRILISLEKERRSVKDLAAELEIDPSIVLEHMTVLKTRGLVDFGEIVGITPMFYKM